MNIKKGREPKQSSEPDILRAIGALLVVGVSVTAVITAIRQYSAAYVMIDPSREYALIAAFMTVGALILMTLFPTSSRYGFHIISGSVVIAFAVAAAPKLGLIEHAPLFWRVLVLVATTAPIGAIFFLFRGLTQRAKVGESGRKFRGLLGESDRNRLRLPHPKNKAGEGRATQLLANPDTEVHNETAESLAMLNETLYELSKHNGNMAATAKALGMTPPGVGERLKRLYKVSPQQVQQHAPDWVRRNIKEDAEV